jgi:N-formylglutamate deformylase
MEKESFETWWRMSEPRGPVVAAALHCGHQLRPDLQPLMNLTESERLREEDPYTDQWRFIAPTRVICLHSRFGLDLNRPPPKAIYRRPEDSWGLQVWQGDLPEESALRSMADYGAFYQGMERLLRELERRHRAFLILDLHTYNHRRGGPEAPPEDPAANPEINLGTGTMDREYWAPLADRFLAEARKFDFFGRHLDVRENVRFFGGEFPAWVHRTFPRTGCALAIEVKKFFMDEWTGAVDVRQLIALRQLLASTIPPLMDELSAIARRRIAA